jgi:hypothetical protein
METFATLDSITDPQQLTTLLRNGLSRQARLATNRSDLGLQQASLLQQNLGFSKEMKKFALLEKSSTCNLKLVNRARKLAARVKLGKGMQQLQQLQEQLGQVSREMRNNRLSLTTIQARIDRLSQGEKQGGEMAIGGLMNGAGGNGTLKMVGMALVMIGDVVPVTQSCSVAPGLTVNRVREGVLSSL